MSQSVVKLKELLFDRENATLAELQNRIMQLASAEQMSRQQLAQVLQQSISAEIENRRELAKRFDELFDRTGTEAKLRASVAAVLDGAFRDAEVQRHEQLCRAVAPVVVKTIKTELRNSQDEMVEALYPITGQLVKSYVASAMRDLANRINRRLSGGTSPLMLRFRSVMTGRSVAELALTDVQHLEVVELFLIRRGSGELLQHWPESNDAGLSNSKIHLSGVLTAINDFAAQALKDDGGALRSFSLDEFHMYLRGSPGYLLAAKCRGEAPAGVEQILDEEFLRLLERYREVLRAGEMATPPPLLSPLAQNLEQKLGDEQRKMADEAGLGVNPLKVIAVAILLPLLAVVSWTAYTRYETANVRAVAGRAIEATPALKGYPVKLDVAHRGRALAVTGLVPTQAAKADVVDRLRAMLPDVPVSDGLAVLPNQGAELESQVSRVHRDLAGLENELLRSSLRRALTRAVKNLEVTLPELRRLDLALVEAGSRATVKSASAVLDRSSTEVQLLQSRIATGPFDLGQMNTIASPMHAITLQLRQATVELATLLSKGSAGPSSAHGDGAPSDVMETAEELSLAAAQLAATAIAVAQSAAVKPAPVIVPPPPAPTALEKLEKWMKTSAIFFGDGVEFRSNAAAEAALATAAPLIREAGVLVRLIGYTDDRGVQTRNASLAQQRAQRVFDALAERGVPKQLMVAVGRANGLDISTVVGAQSANRRVEFEIGFAGEAGEGQ